MQKRRNDVKARTTLLLALPNEHQLRFNKYKMAQELWAAILKTFGGNEATTKTKKNFLKQQSGNFKVEGKETLEQTFNRLQAIISQLEFMDIEIEQDDLNQKLLTSLSLEWLMHTIVWRNRSDLDTMSLDDLYNNLKVYDPEVQKKSDSQNMAFISSSKNNSGNKEDNTAGVSTASTQVSTAGATVAPASISLDTACTYIASQSNGSQIKYDDINQINEDDIKEMDIKWNTALLSMRADRYRKKTGKKISIQGTDVAGFDKSKVECFNCHKLGHFSRECRAPRSQDRGRRDNYRQGSKVEEQAPKALMAINRVGWDLSFMENEEENHALIADEEAPIEFALMAKTSADSECCPPPPAQVYSPPKKDMSWTGLPDSSASENEESIGGILSKLEIKFVRPADTPTVVKTDKVETAKKPTIKKFPTGNTKFSTADMGNKGKAGNSQNHIDDKGYWDSGCSRYMTGNISYLSDYEPFDGGYVSFGQGGCKITGKGTIKIDKHEFENVYFVNDLKYNLFSVSQICDNKNSILFTNSECIVLGRDFKLADDTNVLLRTPRQHNMYSIDLNNIVPHKDLTCLVAKASADECILWHRRLARLNFKTMTKLVKHNLVRGLPTKCFENDHNCTACLKGKQYKASLIDDFSRFTWTFFLKTKDVTSGILRNLITEIENLKELRVKIISKGPKPRWENDSGKLDTAPDSLSRSSSRLASDQSSNPTSSTNPNPKGRNHGCSKQRIENSNLEEQFPPIVTMVDQRTMAQLLQAPTKGYEDAIVVPTITADNFELKHGLLTLVQNKQFYGLDKEDPHAHIRYFNKITSTLKFSNVPNTSIKIMLYPLSLEGAAWIWLEKEPPRSILTWDDLVSKFMNQFFPLSKTTSLRNEITNFQQRFNETLNQDSLNSAVGGNFLDKMPCDCLSIIESMSKVHYSRDKSVVTKVSTTASTSGVSPDVAKLKDLVRALLLDKKGQNQSPALVKAVEESCVSFGGAHSYRNYPANVGNVYRDNIQKYVSQASAVNYNQGNTGYRPQIMSNQIQPPGFPPVPSNQNVQWNNQNHFILNQNRGKNFNQGLAYQPLVFQQPAYQAPAYQAPTPQTQSVLKEYFSSYVKANDAGMKNILSSGTLPSNTIAIPKSDFKAITTQSGVSYDGTQILPPVMENEPEATKDTPAIASVSASKPNPKASISYPSRRNNERNHEKANNQIEKFYQFFKDMSFEISFVDALIIRPKFASTLKALIRNKENLSEMARTPLNEHCSTVLLKKLLQKLGYPGKFLIQCDFPELADRSISRSIGIAEDVYVKVGSFHFSADFVVVDFDAEPRVPLILGISFLNTGRALIDVFKGELTLRVGKDSITFNLDQTSRFCTKSEQNQTKSRSNGKHGKARQCQSPVIVKKAEKEKKIQTKGTKTGKP
nr:hypothetical protein [Tanacetum cinerariifolium]